MDCEHFFIVNKGEFQIHVEHERSAEKNIHKTKNHNAGPGESFGELALLYHFPRAATITSTMDGELFVIDRADFHLVLKNVSLGGVCDCFQTSLSSS